MTALTVRFFASLREAVGVGDLDIEVDPPTLVGLRSALATRLTPEQFHAIDMAEVCIAVNQAIAQRDTPLRAGDEVAFLPRVTGG